MEIKFQYVTDVEGDLDFFKKQIRKSQVVRFTNEDENELEFIEPEGTTQFVFGGDVCDNGSDITITSMLVTLKEKHPERVTLILGNRDANKTRFATELPLKADDALNVAIDDVIEPAFSPKCRSFKDFLVAKFNSTDKTLNTPVNRLKWILEDTMGAPQAFEKRRAELATLTKSEKSSISDQEVYRSFRESVEPDGFMRKYLSLAQIGTIIGDTLIVHGSVTDKSMGQVPNGFDIFEEEPMSFFQTKASEPKTVYEENVHQWIAKLNDWYQQAVARWISAPSKTVPHQFSHSAPSSPMQHIASGPGSKYLSLTPVVGTFLKDRRTPEMTTSKVAHYLQQGGISLVLAGHQPHGDTPLCIIGASGEEIDPNSLQILTCDTLYGNKDAYHPQEGVKTRANDPRGSSYATVHVTCDTELGTRVTHIEGVTGFNQSYSRDIYFPRKAEDKFLGRILKDKESGVEYIVRINSATSNDPAYDLTYVEGPFAVMHKFVTREYLEEQEELGAFLSTVASGDKSITPRL